MIEHGFVHSSTYVDEDLNGIYSCQKNLNTSKFCEQVRDCMENWMSDSPEAMMDVLAHMVLRDKNSELAMKKSITYAIAEEIGIPDYLLKPLETNIIRNCFSNIDIMLSSVLLNQVIERE